MTDRELMNFAHTARKSAYAPYSGFSVGAALLTHSGRVYTGCNIENSAYSPGVCAERTAIFKAVSEGERSFEAIAVCAGDCEGKIRRFAPCGVCRQVMREFCDDGFRIILTDGMVCEEFTLGELLPEAFSPDALKSGNDR